MTSRNYIEEIIEASLEYGLAISIKLPGKTRIFTAVQNYQKKEKMRLVILMPQTLYGQQLEETVVLLDEIEEAHVLNVLYNDPLYKKLREIKKILPPQKK